MRGAPELPLSERLAALERAAELLEPVAAPEALSRARTVIDRVGGRSALSAEHTVVGFFGATGSGKSSLVNAVVGREITRAAARRPTTARPVAAIVSEPGSQALLDWLDVGERAVLTPEDSGLAAAAVPTGGRGSADRIPGLILLDLPDLDSVSAENRQVAERMTGLVDVIVWVTDPQKYADDVLHRQFVAPFAAHDATTLVVLNQIDRIRPAERSAVLASLGDLVRADGLTSAPVLGVSAETGESVPTLREMLVQIARDQEAATARLRTEVSLSAGELTRSAPPEGLPADVRPEDVDALVTDLGSAARIEPVAQAVGASYRHRATAAVGWPPLRWLRRLRPDPLRRLGIGREGAGDGLSRTSLPQADAATVARASSGVRAFADATSTGASEPWRAAVGRAARSREEQLPDALDQVVAGADLRGSARPWWWPVLDVVQWVALAAVLVGLIWLTVVAGLAYLHLPQPTLPMVTVLELEVPVPTLLVGAGLLIGILAALAGAALAVLGGRRAAGRARRVLRERTRGCAQTMVVEPVEDVLDTARDARTALELAQGRAPSARRSRRGRSV